ncbi:MAG: type II secretion system F family protein [archaeon]|jgi:hypothetical protein|nr:type II secretion system F family protein [archaeon]MDD2477456.1 type II secretion system F family protein [Candidatus ainarchaeum sp.]MDD3084739.1 type II secretion system F family protein [Candidatus ainarchaeum sp.]MDD4220988.1 type II secretion system F family protein [Candidatus ainarchaeum sp.]MDD4662440.1 type II secretion system F family protein [Candidatus ainarchaeum sp.]
MINKFFEETNKIIESNLVLFILINLVVIFIFYLFNLSILFSVALALALDILFIIFKIFYIQYQFQVRKKALEVGLIDEVLKISSIPKKDIKLVFSKLINSNNKIISEEFLWAYKKIEKGHSLKDIFSILKKKYNSEILNRFLDLIITSVNTGSVSSQDYKNLAKTFLKSKELINDRKSLLLMQKYTIIFAGGLIVPGILGVIISLVKKLGEDVDLTLIGLNASTSLYSVAYYCSIIYIIEYVIISSIYLSLLEDESKNIIIYLILLLPVSLLIFFVSKFLL